MDYQKVTLLDLVKNSVNDIPVEVECFLARGPDPIIGTKRLKGFLQSKVPCLSGYTAVIYEPSKPNITKMTISEALTQNHIDNYLVLERARFIEMMSGVSLRTGMDLCTRIAQRYKLEIEDVEQIKRRKVGSELDQAFSSLPKEVRDIINYVAEEAELNYQVSKNKLIIRGVFYTGKGLEDELSVHRIHSAQEDSLLYPSIVHHLGELMNRNFKFNKKEQ